MNTWPAFLISERLEDADPRRLLAVLQQDPAEIEAGSVRTGASARARGHTADCKFTNLLKEFCIERPLPEHR